MLNSLHLTLEQDQKEKLMQYIKLLLEELDKQRIIGESSVDDIINRQIYDSVYPLKLLNIPAESRILDLGTGGGLPGIPLKICKPDLDVHLLDANKKRVILLSKIIEKLHLKNTHVIHGRAEKIGQEMRHREKFNIVLSKAVAKTSILAELTLPLANMDGKVLLYKGPKGEAEIDEAKGALELCGGEHERTWDYRLPTGEKRKLLLIRKINKTPEKYPRREGKPEKAPLRWAHK
ncbi:MAG: 16S rRNA (guanine(527)-N(7))-methyltransferase RsmG [Bacillota bacterium]